MNKAIDWLREHDPNFGALRRATRAAIVMPGMLAIADKVIANAQVATFAAFGSFAMLLLVDFAGLDPRPARGRSCARGCVWRADLPRHARLHKRVAGRRRDGRRRLRGHLLGGRQLGAGRRDDTAAAVLHPAGLAAGAGLSIPDRVAGWGLASAAALLAISLLWPAPSATRSARMAVSACRALANRLRTEVTFMLSGRDPALQPDREHAIEHADHAIEQLESTFFATPYRPTGLSTDARAVVRLVDELRWLNSVVLRSAPRPSTAPPRGRCARSRSPPRRRWRRRPSCSKVRTAARRRSTRPSPTCATPCTCSRRRPPRSCRRSTSRRGRRRCADGGQLRSIRAFAHRS